MNAGQVRFFKYVALDVVGYSRRSAERMAAIVAAINELVLAVLQEEQMNEDDWLSSTAGDAVFIALPSPDDFDLHVRIAIRLLRHVKARNETVAENERFEIRIGIYQNTDNVVLDLNGKLTIAGDGINLSERVMSLADGNQILLGDVVHAELRSREQYRDKLIEFKDVEIKHGSITVWQYVDRDIPELNCDIPSKILNHQSAISVESGDRPIEPDQIPEKADVADLPPVGKASAAANDGDRDRTQIADAVQALSESLVTGAERTPDEIQLIRVQLTTTAFLSKSLPTSMLGVHEANRLYGSRESVALTVPELVAMLRLLVTDSSDYVPGWYWLSGVASVEGVIINLAITDPYSYTRSSAFNLLARAGISIATKHQDAIEAVVKGDSAPEVRQQALRFVGRVGDESCRPIIGAGLLDPVSTVVRQAKQSQYLFLARVAPTEAVGGLVTESVSDIDEILSELIPRVTEVSGENLVKATGSTNTKLRLFAIKELASRGRLTVEQAEALVNDENSDVKTEAYRFLVAQRAVDFEEIRFKLPDNYMRLFSRTMLSQKEPVEDSRREIVLLHYSQFGYEELIQMIDWQQLSGSEAYLALAMNFFDRFGDRLRADLESDFSQEAKAYYEQELPTSERIAADRETGSQTPTTPSLAAWRLFGRMPPKETTPEEDAQSITDSRKEDYLTAALAGLVRNGRADDVKFARRFVRTSHEELRLEVVKLLRRFGDAADVALLVRIAKSNSGLAQEYAANAALELADDKYVVADELITTRDELLISIVVVYLTRSRANAETLRFLLPFLRDVDEKIRARVIAYFVHSCSAEELTKILTEYLEVTGTYYYDVVCAFDRAIYAPPPIAIAYRESLDKRFFGLLDH
jgi:class 3 adenylate cyclase